MLHSRTFRSIIILLVALVFASTAYALAAGNTVADGGMAGDGQGAIAGYDVSTVKYDLNNTTPSQIDSVTFTLDATANEVGASLLDNAATPNETVFDGGCTSPDNLIWTCTFSSNSATASAAFELRVIAAQ